MNSDHTAQVTISDEAGGLDSVLYVAKYSKVMLTSKLWQQTGLCNGAIGMVQDIFRGCHRHSLNWFVSFSFRLLVCNARPIYGYIYNTYFYV